MSAMTEKSKITSNVGLPKGELDPGEAAECGPLGEKIVNGGPQTTVHVPEIVELRAALESIAGWRNVNISGEYEHGLRDIIRSVTDCAQAALDARRSGGDGASPSKGEA